MQRYRVNFPLLIGLVVGTIVLLGGGFAIWRVQLEKSADRLINRAEEAKEDGNLEKTVALYSNYLRLRPEDNEVRARFAMTMADIAESPDVEPKKIGQAIGVLEGAVREQPDNDELRERLVELYMSRRVRMLKPALDHITQMLNRHPGDKDLEVKRSTCLFGTQNPKAIEHAYKLIGYDATTDDFDNEEAIAPQETSVYLRVAGVLRSERQESELADRVVDQMVDANLEDGKAHLYRGQYKESSGRSDDSQEDFDEALRLAPDDPEVVVVNARVKMRDEDYDAARSLLGECLEENPESAALYQSLAEIEVRDGQYDKALEWFKRGIDALPESQEQMLLFAQARLQIEQNDIDGARETIDTMRKSERVVTAYVDYLDARLKMRKGDWYEAAKQFEELRGVLSASGGSIAVELDMMRGLCYEKLGQFEKARNAYEATMQIDPGNKMASLGRSRVLGKLGQKDSEGGASIYILMAEELAKPEAEQDWVSFDNKMEAYIEHVGLGDAMLEVLRGEVLMRRGLFKEAREKLIGSYRKDPNNLGVRRAAVKLYAADPSQGPVKALKLLDKVVGDFGDMPILRLERGDLLIAINDEDLTEQLFALTDNMDAYADEQKVQVWDGLAKKFEMLRDTESRRVCLARVAELSPSDLSTLLRLFSMARQTGDEAGMLDAQKRILDVVGSEDNATWQYTEANRLIAEYRANSNQGDGLDKAEAMVKRALNQRSEWHRLHQLQAEIALLKGDEAAALASFDKASLYGRPTPLSLYQHVKLLIRRGRIGDAVDEMEKVNADIRTRLLGQDYADSLQRLGRTTEAVTAAEAIAANAPNNGATQLWYGQFLSRAAGDKRLGEEYRAKLRETAGESLAKAVDLIPGSPDAWLALTGYLVANQKPIEAEDVIRRAQLALGEDDTVLLFARCYELVGRMIDAEALYLQAVEEALPANVVRTNRLLAQFYLGPVYQGTDKNAKAIPHINAVLREAAEGRTQPNDQHVRWARTTAARLLAATREYQKLRDAEHLLASNSIDGKLPLQERLLMAQILAPRPEPVSRLKAAKLLEEITQTQQLSVSPLLDLGKLYFALGEWGKCREHMVNVIAKHPNNPQVRLLYIGMLLDHGEPADIDNATRQLQRLVKMAPKSSATREMIARVAYKRGKKREASAAVRSMLPADLSKLTKEQLPAIKRVAARLNEFNDHDSAKKYFEVAAKLGGIAEKLDYAEFKGEHFDAEEAFRDLERLRGETDMARVVQKAIEVVRAQEAAGDTSYKENLAKVEEWVQRGLREDPDSIAMRLQLAEMHDFKQEYEKAADEYRSLLGRDDLRGMARAVVLNNLAYLLALSTDSGSEQVREAEGYLTEAVNLLGPQTDVLDTRAVIALAAERYDDAIADLELAVIDRPTASKFFHKAAAHIGVGQTEEAILAWEKAVELGLTREGMSRLERDKYDQLKQQLEGAGLRSAGL